jgi:hypothetical protein
LETLTLAVSEFSGSWSSLKNSQRYCGCHSHTPGHTYQEASLEVQYPGELLNLSRGQEEGDKTPKGSKDEVL